MADHDGEITTLQSLMKVVRRTGIPDMNLAHIRLWFRGQTQDKPEHKLCPGVYRSTFGVSNEEERIEKERQMAQDFRVESVGLLGEQSNEKLYFLMQHYKMPTRLLDWTMNPLASLYFAVSDHEEDNGMLFMMDALRLAHCQEESEKAGQKGIATSRNPRFKSGLKTIFDWADTKNLPQYIMAARPDHFETRIVHQRGCFTFHGTNQPELTTAANDSLCKFLIPHHTKTHIREELQLLGVDEFSIYQDLDHLSDRLRRIHKA